MTIFKENKGNSFARMTRGNGGTGLSKRKREAIVTFLLYVVVHYLISITLRSNSRAPLSVSPKILKSKR